MILVPAIDIRGGRAVRLRQGDFSDEAVYSDDPAEAARAWVDAGARMLHVVDLDGARTGSPAATDELRRISRSAGVTVQFGGGLRSLDAVARALDAGADRAVVGTAALTDERFLDDALERFGDRLVVSVDARGGRVTLAGWTESTDAPAPGVVERLVRRGVRRIVHTDVDRDGTLDGPNLDGIRAVAAAARDLAGVLCSGGVGAIDDLRSLAAMALPEIEGVIAGKALYERRFGVAEGQAVLDGAASPR